MSVSPTTANRQPTTAVILSIGDELLRGKIVDTNFAFLAKRLYRLGIGINYHNTVPDAEEWVCAAFGDAVGRAEIVIATGGLGPTPDDATRTGLARFLGTKLVFNKQVEKKIRDFFKRRKIAMPENNLLQAYLPEDAVPIENPEGTAPGIFVKHQGKLIFLLPGPPREMKAVLKSVELILQKEIEFNPRAFKIFRTVGVPESLISTWAGVMDLPNKIEISYYPSLRGVDVFIAGEDEDDVNSASQILLDKLKPYTFADDESNRLEAVIGKKLIERKETLAVAESCTGGMLASRLVDISGSSEYFPGGIVSYSNEVKVKFLRVDENTLAKHGAVSAEVAGAMSEGVKTSFDSTFGIGITGIAGPSGGNAQKPVGLVYIALATPDNTVIRKYELTGGRDAVRTRSATAALNILWLALTFGDIEEYPFQDGGEFVKR